MHGGSRGGVLGGCRRAVLSCVGTAALPLGAVCGKVLLWVWGRGAPLSGDAFCWCFPAGKNLYTNEYVAIKLVSPPAVRGWGGGGDLRASPQQH